MSSLHTFDFSSENLDREFPVRRNLIYWNHAAQTPLPRRVAQAIAEHLENTRDRGASDWRRWYAQIDAAREKAARLIGARPSEVAFLPSTSWGLNLVAHAFSFERGDNVVGDDMEFPANVYPWMRLEKQGVEYRLAKSRQGRVTVDDIAAQVDARTRIVTVSWVAFHNGWVYPIEEIGELCRERGILFVVDAIQGLGALPIDVETIRVDVLVADAHKWLLGPEACALFWVSENARERLPTPFGGWWNVQSSHGYLSYDSDYYLSARRYEPGSLPTAQILGLSAALDLLSEVGIDSVRERILFLVAALAEGLRGMGWNLTTPEPFASGILSAVPPTGDSRQWAKRLEQRSVIAAPREGAVRFSPHFYNDAGEVARALAIIEELTSKP